MTEAKVCRPPINGLNQALSLSTYEERQVALKEIFARQKGIMVECLRSGELQDIKEMVMPGFTLTFVPEDDEQKYNTSR